MRKAVLPSSASSRARPQRSALSSPAAKAWGLAALCVAAGAAIVPLRTLTRDGSPRRTAAPARKRRPVAQSPEVRRLHGASSLLATSVLADSALQHYRGMFQNPGMFAPLITSALTLLAGLAGALQKPRLQSAARGASARTAVYASALAVGAAGTAFHVYNVGKRPGGVNWLNIFYAAPLGAPGALSLAGGLGLAAQRLQATTAGTSPTLLGVPAGRALAAITSVALLGAAGEAGLLHFRGAFHNPFMWLPVSVPPVASLLLADAALGRRSRAPRWLTRSWLRMTALLGAAGMGFHAYGIARAMGGWRNWSQNVLSGPPLPAPSSFTALAVAGLSALSLITARSSHRNGRTSS
ncbi:MAG: hypothetical protein M3Z31_17045 [Pseudomonadota bacterium]|nr:hypothetical protein [Pseudomonadota bacterium]